MRRTPDRKIAATYAREGVVGLVEAGVRRVFLEPYWRLLNRGGRSDRKVVWLHIGVHKTGTTTIQDCLRANRYRLRRYSINFDGFGYGVGKRLMNEAPLDRTAREHLASELRERLARRPERTVIFSAETMCGDPYSAYSNIDEVCADLRAVLDGFDVRIVGVIRRQDHFIESLYQQYIKGGRSATFAEFRETCDVRRFCWSRLLQVFEDQFGRENMHVHLFESLFAEGRTVVERLFEGLGQEFQCVCPEGRRRNPGLSPTGFEILRRANDLLSADECGKLRRWLEQEFQKLPGDELRLFSETERAELLVHFAESNRRVFEKYLPEEDVGRYGPGAER